MTYQPKNSNHVAPVTTVILFAVGAVSFLGSGFLPYKMLFELTAVLTVTLGIQLTQKYLLTTYEYRLNDLDTLHAHNDLIVVKKQGKRETVLCNLTLNAAVAAVRDESLGVIEKTYGKMGYRFHFFAELFPADRCGVILEFNGKRTLIRLQGNEDFYQALCERIAAQSAETER